MMRKRRLVCTLMVAAMTLCLAACGKTDSGTQGDSGNSGAGETNVTASDS